MKDFLGNTRRHDIAFNADGRIEISARVSKALGIEPGDVIDIAEDERTREFYIYVKHKAGRVSGKHKAVCRATSRRVRKCHSLRAHSVEICRQVLDLCGFSVTQAKLPVGEPEEIPCVGPALPVIIRFNRNS